DSYVGKPRELGLFDGPLSRSHDHIFAFFKIANRRDSGKLFGVRNIDEINDRFTASGCGGVRYLVNLEPIDLAFACKNHYIAVSRGDEDVIDDIVGLGRSSFATGASATLSSIH